MTSVQDGSGIDPTLLVCAPEAPQAAAPSSTPSPGTKRAADPAAEQPPVKVARSSEEEKKARLLARQQRNRQSAQVSREKKKAHIEQLEQEVQQLREEKKAWAARDFEAQQKQRQLESQVSDLGAKVHNLETLLVRLVQHSQASKETVSHDAIPSQLTQIVSALSTHRSVDERVAGAEAASAAPAVAPSSVVPTQRLSPSSDSTCLPAAKATSADSTDLLSPHLAQQRVQNNSKSWSSAAEARARKWRMRQPMAAALRAGSQTTCSPRAWMQSPTTWRTPTIRTRPSAPGCPRRVLRIRLRIPSHRLSMALKQLATRPTSTPL